MWVLEQAGVNRSLLADAKSRKLKYFAYIMRGEVKSLEKGIIQGTLAGNRKRGRPKTAWMDNVISWMGRKLEDEIRKVDNRSECRTTIHSTAQPRYEDGYRLDKRRPFLMMKAPCS